MKKLKMHIHDIKCIKDVSIEFPIEKGLYAITGQNGSGKSTIVACASSVFFNLPMNDYFGETNDDACIDFELEGKTRSWKKVQKKWESQNDNMNIRGFYEGSLIFGFRFRDTSYSKLKRASNIDKSKLFPSNDFIRKYLGIILQGDENYYEQLYEVSNKYGAFDGDVFYYEKNGKLVSQFHMSTGENLLISILNSLHIKIKENRQKNISTIIFLDEIELALHPSSLKRLVTFLNNIADQYNYAIYFSTHSIELLSGIKPENIFYVERFPDNTTDIINPCYPAYATKFLYDHTGYDRVILVEDDLAKEIITRILRKERLLDRKLVHVLPCGGYSNVLRLANEVIENNLLGKIASISVVLDKDIKEEAISFKIKNKLSSGITLSFLPVDSLEKYLRQNLVSQVNHRLFKHLSDYLFLKKSLSDIIAKYKTTPEYANDFSGKALWSYLSQELSSQKMSRNDICEMVVDYIFEKEYNSVSELVSYLKDELI